MAAQKPTVAILSEQVRSLQEDNQKIVARLYESEHVIKSLNIALIGLAFTMKVSPKRIEGTDADAFLKFIEANVHPIIRRADVLTNEIGKRAKSDIASKAKEAAAEATEVAKEAQDVA